MHVICGWPPALNSSKGATQIGTSYVMVTRVFIENNSQGGAEGIIFYKKPSGHYITVL